MEQFEKHNNVLDLRKLTFEKNHKSFSSIAAEIRNGLLQAPITQLNMGDYLFGQTDEILYFALKGEKLSLESPNYQTELEKNKQNILTAVKKIIEAVSKIDIKNTCPHCSMDASAERIRLWAETLR